MSNSEGDNKYVLHIYTGSKLTAGTDANILITLFGNHCDSGERYLDNIENNFEKDKKDVFVIRSKYLGVLSKIKIGHDNSGAGPAWFLDKVVVGDAKDGTMYEFMCDRWLADDEEDNQIVRELECTNITPGTRPDDNGTKQDESGTRQDENGTKQEENRTRLEENNMNNSKMEPALENNATNDDRKEGIETKPCDMCNSVAAFYSVYEHEKVGLCSRKCHNKYNTTKANAPNILLIQLSVDGENDEEEELNQVKETQEIFEACHRGEKNNTRLIALLETGQSPNNTNKLGQTLMTYSIVKGDIKTIRILHSAGADINEADGSSRTPLMVATNIGAEKKITFLLNENANVHLQDNDGKTVLHMTETNTTGAYAEQLLKHEPELINAKNNFDQTAAHLVAGSANEVVLRVLLEHGTKIDGLDNLGRSPLHWAVLQKAENCVRLLLDHEDGSSVMDLPDRFGTVPIHYAVQSNNINIARMLIEKGCRLDVKDSTGRTPLLAAAANDFWDICKLLTKKGSDVSEVDNEGLSALHHAAAKGHSETCILLIKHGADVNHRNKKEQTAMFPAVCNAHVDVVHTLVEKGAKCDSVTDETGRNPSHYAAERGHKGMLRVIIQYSDCCDDEGCDFCNPDDSPLYAQDNDGHTPLYLAAANNNIDCLRMMIKRGFRVDDESYKLLTEMGLIDMVNLKGADDDQNSKPDIGAAAWRKKYLDQKKRSMSLEDQLNKLKSLLDLHHRRLISQMERRDLTKSVPKRLRDSQLAVCQLSDETDLLRLEAEVTRTRVTSEAQLHSNLQKDINDIRDLRTDYRNAHKAYSQRLQHDNTSLSLFDAPDWLTTPRRLGEMPKMKATHWKTPRNVAYLELFKKSNTLKPGKHSSIESENSDTASRTSVVKSAEF